MSEDNLKITIGLLVGLIGLLSTVIKMYHDKNREIELKLSDKKYSTYSEIITTLFDLINKQKGLNNFTEDEILNRVMDVKRDLILYGNDAIIKKFCEWEENQLKKKRLWIWVELVALARQDMGNKRTKIKADDILKSLLNEQNDYKEFKKNTYEFLNLFHQISRIIKPKKTVGMKPIRK